MSTGDGPWRELGARIRDARALAGVAQHDLADRVHLDRTALSKIENGTRGVDAVELFRIAEALERPVEWLLSNPPIAVVNRRAALQAKVDPLLDAMLEALARDVELLREIGTIKLEAAPYEHTVTRAEDVESAAAWARDRIGNRAEPIASLQDTCELLGLLAFVLPYGGVSEGGYVALEHGGVAVSNAREDIEPGRRRFTLAHELGHHILGHEFDTDVFEGDARERYANLFAVFFLMPRAGMMEAWREFGGSRDARRALIRTAAWFRVSWSGALYHASNLGLIDNRKRDEMLPRLPTGAELRRDSLILDPILKSLPTVYRVGVERAYARQKITAERALELLRGSEANLRVNDVPREARRGQLRRHL